MASDEDSVIREIFDSSSFSSSDDEEEDVSEEQLLERVAHIADLRAPIAHYFEEEIPSAYDEGVPVLLYHSVQYIVAYCKYDGHFQVPDPLRDSDDVSKEKIYLDGYAGCYQKLKIVIDNIASTFYNTVLDKLEERVQYEEHPLVFFLEAVEKHKELHCRHLKTDPGVARSKADKVQPTYNAVTGELYDFENPNHKSWRSLIINPLPSDYDYEKVDPEEGGKDHKILIELEKQNGTYNVPEPFSIVVTQEWENMFRSLHSLIHFEDYLVTKVLKCVTNDEWEHTKHMNFADTWHHIMSDEFYDKPIAKLSGGKKKIPPLVSTLIEMREMIKRVVLFAQQ
jgi:hypothetical protein